MYKKYDTYCKIFFRYGRRYFIDRKVRFNNFLGTIPDPNSVLKLVLIRK